MKKTLSLTILLLSIVSFQANALEITGGAVVAAASGAFSAFSYSVSPSVIGQKAAAQLVIDDSQKYFQTGEMTIYLESKISEICSTDSELSTEDALIILLDNAEEVLK